MNNPYQQYQTNSVMTASKEELTLMLYDGIIKFLNQAKECIDAKDFIGANEKLVRVQEILSELNATLIKGNTIGDNLSKIYDFMISETIKANIKKDKVIIDQQLDLARDLRDTWKQAMMIARKSDANK